MIREKTGFTAFELAMTLAIMAVLATLFMPPYLHWLRSSRLSGAANNLLGDIEMAKTRAIRDNGLVVVQFQADEYTIFVDNGEGGGTAGDWTRNGTEDLLRHRRLPSGVLIDTAAMTLPDDRVRFDGRGLPQGVTAAQTITLKNQAGNKDITLNRLGLAELN